MRKHLYINDIDICQFGIYISSDTYLNAPLIDYKEYQIPSRSGNVIQYNKRLNNVIRKFDCYVHETHDIQNALSQLKMLLYKNIGYVKLVSDYDVGKYQYGYLAQAIDVEPFQYDKTASFSLYFSCMPQKYLDEMEQTRLQVIEDDVAQILNRSASRLINDVMANVDSSLIPSKNTFVVFSFGIPTGYGTRQVEVKYATTTPSSKPTYMAIAKRQSDRNEPIFVEYLGMSLDGNMDYVVIDDKYKTYDYEICAIYELENTTYDVVFTQKIENIGETSYQRDYTIKENIFTNDSSFINRATIVFAMRHNSSYSQTSNMMCQCIANDVQIYLDLIKMVDDGIAKYLYDNCTWETYTGVPIFVDIANRSCYGINVNTNERINLDEYCQIYGDINFEDNLTIYIDKENIAQRFSLNYAYVQIDRWVL